MTEFVFDNDPFGTKAKPKTAATKEDNAGADYVQRLLTEVPAPDEPTAADLNGDDWFGPVGK